MLAFGIQYLNGFVAAARPDDRDRPEWPPHPARVFMALAAAHFESGSRPVERQALLWLEALSRDLESTGPTIACCSPATREAVTCFVPVNPTIADEKKARDNERKKGKRPPPPLQSAPGVVRTRQPRTFARAWLEDDKVYLYWREAEPAPSVLAALEELCAKVTRIGHSSSLVQMWLADESEVGTPTWEPAQDRAEISLRVAPPGTLAYLEQRFGAAHVDRYSALKIQESDESDPKKRRAATKALKAEFPSGEPTPLRPDLSVYQGYARPDDAGHPLACGTVFSPHLAVLRLRPQQSDYRALDLCATLQLAQRWRDAALSQSSDLSAEARCALSGHDMSGGPLQTPHLAFAPLAFVGSEHSDGHLLGVGLALPPELDRATRRDVMQAFGRVAELKLGPLGVWRVEAIRESFPPVNLRASAWTAHPLGATQWATVTPIAFDRHPKATNRADSLTEATTMVRRACERIGLPNPREVILTPVSHHLGAPASHEFPRMRRKDGSLRRHTHAILTFDEPVRGPVLLGAGRYRGYGFCRPLD